MALLGMWGCDDSSGEVGVATVATLGASSPRTGVGKNWTSNNNSYRDVSFTFMSAPGSGSVICGFGLQEDTNGSNGDWFKLTDNNGVVQISLRFDSTRHIQIYRGDGGTLLATSTFQRTLNIWNYVEVKAVIASGTSGSVEVKFDGVVVASVTAANTQQAAYTSLLSFSVGTSISGGSANTLVDDVYALDLTGSAPYNTYLGDVVVRTALPTGAGASTGWTPSTGANYAQVNELPASSAQYVGASTTGLTDLYAMTDMAAGSVILAIQNWAYAAKSDGGTPPTTSMVAKGDGGTTRTDSTPLALSVTYQHFVGPIYTTDPDGDALTLTNFNAMQAGVAT